jgi:amino acid adenylation domain-containing protein
MPVFTPVDFDPFGEEKEIEKIILTNEPQREIWLSCILGGEDANLSYNESVSLEIKGGLDIQAFERAVNDLVRRHEALRSTISPNGETLVIYDPQHISLGLIDLSGLNEPGKSNELQSFIRNEINTPLDLKDGPLLKFFLHKTASQQYVFTIIKHHIIGDGWSTGIMLEDLGKMYNAYIKGEEPVLNKVYQLSDYASEQVRFKSTAEYKDTEDFWLNLYKDNVPVLDMPVDHARKSPRSYKGNRFDHQLPKEFVGQVKAIGAKAGCSLVTTLLAAFEVFLYEKTQQTDIVVGLPSSGQAATGLTDLVGHCVNLLPLKSHIDPEMSFTGYLKRRKREVLDAYDHQRITFGELIKKLYIPRDASRIALVPVVFNIDMGMDNAVAFDGLQFKLISNPRDYENFEIFLNATSSAGGLTLEWSYNRDLFDKDSIENFNNDYRSILEKIIANPDGSIDRFVKIEETASEDDSYDEVYIPEGQTFCTLFAQSVKEYTNKTAVSFHDSSVTYQQLSDKTDQLVSYFMEIGIKTGDIIALSVERSIEMVVCLLACQKSGAVYLPLDPEYPLERIQFMLEDSAAKLLIVSQAFKGRYSSKATEAVIEEIWPKLDGYRLKTSPVIKATNLAYIIYTSGSTGKPKGVLLTHHNLVNLLLSVQKTPGMLDSDRLLAITTIAFDIAGFEMYLPLITGAEMIIADNEAIRDGRILINLLDEKRISIMQGTPATWQMLLDSDWEKSPHLKAFSTGEALPKSLAEKLLPRVNTLWNLYGPTETTIWSTIKQVLPTDKIIEIGYPVDNTKIYIIDEHGRRVKNGAEGEIYIGGAGVAAGYLNRPELTAERFVNDKYSKIKGEKLYRTGDLGKISETGDIICLGRLDNQVKMRGRRIELGEIESAIVKLKDVKQSVVSTWGDSPSDKRLVAYVILSNGLATLDGELPRNILQEWKGNLANVLPGFMVPDNFIAVKNFPLTPNAKVDRKALPKPNFKKAKYAAATGNLLTKNEQLIADIWAGVLDVKDLEPGDDFFELGGHSLLAVNVMVEIQRKTGKRLPLAVLFSNSTIEKLALQLGGDEIEWDTIVPIKSTGAKPPIYLVHGSGLNLLMFKPISEHFDAEQPLYGIQAIGIGKRVEVPDTLEEVAAYHIKELLKVNPDGPYNLAGYSYGGIIAFEIARQLIAAGKKINLLGMIDTNAGSFLQPKAGTARIAKKVTRQFHKVPFFVNSFIKYPKESFEYQQLVIKRKFKGKVMTDVNIMVDSYTLYEQGIRDKYNYLMARYHLAPFAIEIALFRVEKRLYFLDDQKYLGWDKIAIKGVRIYTTPGDHKTFLEPPNDEKFAKVIQRAIPG